MIFLPDQVSEHDRKRLRTARAPHRPLFDSTKRFAIDWLTDFWKKRPFTYQDIHPEYDTSNAASAGKSMKAGQNWRSAGSQLP